VVALATTPFLPAGLPVLLALAGVAAAGTGATGAAAAEPAPDDREGHPRTAMSSKDSR
jgi:hypothetical protein